MKRPPPCCKASARCSRMRFSARRKSTPSSAGSFPRWRPETILSPRLPSSTSPWKKQACKSAISTPSQPPLGRALPPPCSSVLQQRRVSASERESRFLPSTTSKATCSRRFSAMKKFRHTRRWSSAVDTRCCSMWRASEAINCLDARSTTRPVRPSTKSRNFSVSATPAVSRSTDSPAAATPRVLIFHEA